MRDIPFFTTQSGVASLTLSQIPYTGCAYFRIQSATDPALLLQECRDFCVAAGAENVYVTGHDAVLAYPYHTQIWKMQCDRDGIPATDAVLKPVTDDTLADWIEIYNQRMKGVSNASVMTIGNARKLLDQTQAYFVLGQDTMLGIGAVCGDCITALASVVPGSGEALVGALNQALTGRYITVEVASKNHAAVKLYERMGFTISEVVSQWHKLL